MLLAPSSPAAPAKPAASPKPSPAATPAVTPIPPAKGKGKGKPGATPAPSPSPSPAASPLADDKIPLPFDLSWGDQTDHVSYLLTRVKATIRERRTFSEKGEALIVQGVPVPGLRETRLLFQEGFLVGIDIDYGASNWGVDRYNTGMAQLRRKLEKTFNGPGQMLRRGPVDNPPPGVQQTLTGYEWKAWDTSVMLVYFQAEKKDGDALKDTFRSLLLRYRFRPPADPAKEPVKKGGKPTPQLPPGEGQVPAPLPGAGPAQEPLLDELPKPSGTPAPDGSLPDPVETTPAPTPAASPETPAIPNSAPTPTPDPSRDDLPKP